MLTPLSPPQTPQVGPYRLLATLGAGGMGTVSLGAAPDGRLVAVKQIHREFVRDHGFRARFKREVAASRRVSGAYTAAVLDADPDAEVPWLASVFIPGPSLQDAVTGAGPLAGPSPGHLAAGLAAALCDIHRAGLVHRDLKPRNVILTEDGPRVIDFGIARATEGNGTTELTHAGSVIGSPAFMSPEQAEGKPLSPAGDVFSLGTVLVMAVTGESPFLGASTPQTLYNVVYHHPDLSALPRELRGVVEACLAKRPEDRPTPEQVLHEAAPAYATDQPWPPAVYAAIAHQRGTVRALLHGSVAPASPEPPGRAKAVAGVTASVAMLAAGAVAMALLLNRADPPTSTTPPGPPANMAFVDDRTAEVTRQVTAGVRTAFTYTSDKVQEHLRSLPAHLTPEAVRQLTDILAAVPAGPRYTVEFTVRESGVRSLTGTRAELLVVGTQQAHRPESNRHNTGLASLSLTAVLVGDRWMISEIRVA